MPRQNASVFGAFTTKFRRPNSAKIAPRRSSKYGAKPTTVDGMRFASQAEAKRYIALTVMARAGIISGLECQPSYLLVVEGQKVGTYKADFRYREVATGETVVEDVKGVLTPVYRLKKKLVRALYNIEIKEIR